MKPCLYILFVMKDNIFNKKFGYVYRNAVAYLIAINFFVYIAINYINPVISGIPLVYWLSLVPVFIRQGYVWQFFTYMFVHMEFFHLFFNMYALFMFGTMLERAIGTKEFLLFYFVTGVLGGVASYLIYISTGIVNLAIMGASGAVYAMLFLTSVMYPQGRVLLFFFLPLRLPVAILLFMGIEIASQFVSNGDGVAHLVHLTSVAIAWIYCLVRFRISPLKVWRSSF